MGSGDLTASTPVLCSTITEVKAVVDALNLAAATDFIMVVPHNIGSYIVFKVERGA